MKGGMVKIKKMREINTQGRENAQCGWHEEHNNIVKGTALRRFH